MCRNIRTLFNFDPPATEQEIRASALQFVRKLSGFNSPSRANEDAFDRAVDEVSDVARRLRRRQQQQRAGDGQGDHPGADRLVAVAHRLVAPGDPLRRVPRNAVASV